MKKRLWIIIILIILVVAVVLTIVFVNIFRDKDTSALAKNVQSVTQSGYLNPENEDNEKIDSYLSSLTSLSGIDDSDKTKITNYLSAFEAFETMGQFFNRQIIFSEYTNSYNQNRVKIENSFSSAQSAVNSLSNYIDTTVSITDPSDDWLSRTWNDAKSWVNTIYSSTWNALSRLMSVYEASVTSKLMNNDFTSLIFDGVETLEAEVESNQSSAGTNLKTFVDAYLAQSNEQYILGYSYNTTLQTEVEDLLQNGKESTYWTSFIEGILV